MKVFGNNGSKGGTSASVDTLIGRQTEILGDVRFTGGLHVDGRIKGKVVAQGDKVASLSVSESGTIEGDVSVPQITLNGMVVGDVRASSKITLAAKARVTGNVYYRILQMEGGALVNGQLVHESGEVTISPAQKSSDGEAALARDELGEARRVKGILGS